MLCTSRVSTRAITILNINKWLTQCYKLLWHTALCWWYKFALLKQVPQRHNKKINFDLKNIVHCLIANKISLNTGKTEIILFRTKTIEIKNHMNFRISDQKINIAKEAKYSELDQLLTFKQHTHTIKIKLNRTNGFLVKIRYHSDSRLLKTIYSAIFETHLQYGCQPWGQTQTEVKDNIEKIQNKALQNNFKGPWESSSPLYKE